MFAPLSGHGLRFALFGVSLIILSACGAASESGASGDQTESTELPIPDGLDPAFSAVRNGSRCPSNVDVEHRPFDEQLALIDGWYEVTAVVPGSRVTEQRSPGLPGDFLRLDVADARSGRADTIEVRLSDAWSSEFESAIESDAVSTYMGTRPGVQHEDGVEPSIVQMTFAVNGSSMAFAGFCTELQTEHMEGLFGRETVSTMLELIKLNSDSAATRFRELVALGESEPVDYNLMPQFVPGLANDPGLNPDELVERSARTSIPDIRPTVRTGVCIGTDDYVGDCAPVESFETLETEEPSRRSMILTVFAPHDADIVFYRVAGLGSVNEYTEVARVPADQFDSAEESTTGQDAPFGPVLAVRVDI